MNKHEPLKIRTKHHL